MSNPIIIEFLGILAGAFLSLGYVLQLIKGIKTRNLKDLSFGMLVVFFFGISTLIIYGWQINAFAIVVTNTFMLFCCIMLMSLKIIFKRG